MQLWCHSSALESVGVHAVRLRDAYPRAQFLRLLIESTYGDRTHSSDSDEALVRIISETAHGGGVVIVPAFAVGRTQELIWTIRRLEEAGRLPFISVYIDSPMAIDVTRILHHLKRRLPDHRNAVLLCGFQAAGTRGRALQDGATTVSIHGEYVPVRAQVATIDGLSAHADQSEILRWLRGFQRPPFQTYVVHGEPGPAHALAATIEGDLGWPAAVANHGATIPVSRREL